MALDATQLPKHVAVIMDGNRRWAAEHHLPAAAGHKVAVDQVLEELIETAGEIGIPYMTFWAWSSENWKRPEDEVDAIMQLFRWGLAKKAKRFIERGARLNVIGNWRVLPEDIVTDIEKTLEISKTNTKITVTFALNYGGRDEIIRAIHKISSDSPNQLSNYPINQLSPQLFSQFLDTSDLPDPDLIVRPGGEQRLSGFLLWQSEYAELYFPNVKMPDFRKEEFLKALAWYGTRERRFGGGAGSK